jgi:hypothetical protein
LAQFCPASWGIEMLSAIIIGINLIYPPQPRYICLPSGAGQTSTCRVSGSQRRVVISPDLLVLAVAP